MDDTDDLRLSPIGSWPGCTPSCPAGEHTHYVGSYEPLVPAEPVVVDPEDAVPPKGTDEVEVWLTGWQVEEDGFDVVLGEQVDWELVPMDQQWLDHLFAGRRMVPRQRDTYAAFFGELYGASSWTRCVGRVTRIDQVSVRYPAAGDPAYCGAGIAEIGGAMQHTVSRLQVPRGYHGGLVGWIVRIENAAA